MSKAEIRNPSGSDLKLAEFFLGADLQVNKSGDVDVTSGEMNLAQAILHRIRTSKGELAELGHPEYGSSVLDFVGQENNWMTRQRLRLAIRDTIRQEPRVKEIVSIAVNPRQLAVSGTGDSSGRDNSMDKKTGILAGSGSTTTAGSLSNTPLVDESLEGHDLREAFSGQQQEEPQQQLLQDSLRPEQDDILNTVDIDIVIVPTGSTTQPIQMGFPFNLEGV
ncbi:MAG TPA: hypothetical protein VJP79_12245 [Nitrososphaera sp.]|nr:hypothetical protein [Nitrososphaera sp.]